MLLHHQLCFRLINTRGSSRIRWSTRWFSSVSANSEELKHAWTNDVLVSGLNKVQDISVRVVSCKDVLQRCVTNGNLTDPMGTALGELVVCGSVLSSTLKDEETMQYNVVGPNPGENMIVVCDGEMNVRAKVGSRFPEHANEFTNNDSVEKLFGHGGQFQCIRNHPVWKAPIPSATALRNMSLAMNAGYFVQESEGRTAALMTAVKVKNQTVEYAIGALIERLPRVVLENGEESGDENLEMIIKNVEAMQKRGLHSYITTAAAAAAAAAAASNDGGSGTDAAPVVPDFYIKNRTKIDIDPDVSASLHNIMDEILRNPVNNEIEECGMRWFKNPTFKCSCSMDKVWGSLRALSKADLDSMVADGKGAQVRCDFCGTQYNVTSEEIGQRFQ